MGLGVEKEVDIVRIHWKMDPIYIVKGGVLSAEDALKLHAGRPSKHFRRCLPGTLHPQSHNLPQLGMWLFGIDSSRYIF